MLNVQECLTAIYLQMSSAKYIRNQGSCGLIRKQHPLTKDIRTLLNEDKACGVIQEASNTEKSFVVPNARCIQ